MLKKWRYWIYRLLSKVTRNEKRLYYRQKKRQLKKQITYEKYGALGHALQKIEDYQAYQKFYILFKQRFNIEIPADVCGDGNFFELVHIPLKKIKGFCSNGSPRPLAECAQYKYLETKDEKIYLDYLARLKQNGSMTEDSKMWNLNRFQALVKQVKAEGYLPTKSAIVVNKDYVIRDGLHRACILLYEYGGDYEIAVVQVSRR